MQGGRDDLVRRKIRLPDRPGGLPRLPAAKPREAPITIRRLRRSELPADTVALARFLIGKIVVRELPGVRLNGRIVETEAYPQRDPAAHHFRGPTPRNRSMFLRRGHAYVYFSYGNHFMLNVSAEIPGIGGGVLIRALEPLEGIQQMEHHRKTTRLLDLARGPGRLASALRIDRSLDGIDLCAPGPLWLGTIAAPRAPALNDRAHRGGTAIFVWQAAAASTTVPAAGTRPGITLGKSPRIGITRAAHRLLRFYERGSPFVSGPASLRS
jgi:DNA-3-methyladenine glycosylase